jgi:hypothetical protein
MKWVHLLVAAWALSFSVAQAQTAITFSVDANKSIYSKNYPKGDFYYLIAGLKDKWTESDYGRFYKIAKKLSNEGFRVIINVDAQVADVKEAIANPNTSAIIWNSHGSEDGVVYDSTEEALPKNIFTKNHSKRLKYILFGNCYGTLSTEYYGLQQDTSITSFGWKGEVDSDMFFHYLESKKFYEALP